MTEGKTAQARKVVEIARTLSEAMPYLRRYDGVSIVVKYGGHAMGDRDLARSFARDMALLKQVGVNPVVVHGGGPQIGAMLDKLRIKSQFHDGLRVTDAQTVEVVEMVLAGRINKAVVQDIVAAGGRAVGLSGKDFGLIEARKLTRSVRDPDSNIERALDLGFVGEPTRINAEPLNALIRAGFVPVIAPVGYGVDGETFNINADTAAGAVAGATGASRLLLLTDVPGVKGADGEVITELTVSQARGLIDTGVVSGGMIPKVEACFAAIDAGAEAVVIIDGRTPHAVLVELFTASGVGTMIRAD